MSDETPTASEIGKSSSLEVASQVGPYKVLGKLGEGGFGVVYEAEQAEPVRRRVALKLIKPGMDTASVVARFEAERQALAMMNHDAIAKVFDGGVTDAAQGSRPYFVMELVRGEPIADFCDRHTLTLDERVRLFVHVCGAVQHAHAKGVVHRDLKPNNILVAYDGAGHAKPKVIDFGVAKALDQRLGKHTIFTQHGQLIGTPAYMSPEQAEMSRLDIDTRADVYSLGVVLYELLAGRRPFDLEEAAAHEIQRIIREETPPKPSTRLSTMISGDADEATRVIKARHADARTLTGVLKRDLDWVVMRCLEKDRERRYQTANALAAELERYLAGEAVEAGPPSVRYRARKFITRNKGPVAAGAVIAMLLVGGVVGTSMGMAWAVRERDIANARTRELDATFDLVVGRMFGSIEPNSARGRAVPVSEVLAGIDREGALTGEARVDGRVLGLRGMLWRSLGELEKAEADLARAIALLAPEAGRASAAVLELRLLLADVQIYLVPEPGEGGSGRPSSEALIEEFDSIVSEYKRAADAGDADARRAHALALTRQALALDHVQDKESGLAASTAALDLYDALMSGSDDAGLRLDRALCATYHAQRLANEEGAGRDAALREAESLAREALRVRVAHFGEESTWAAESKAAIARVLSRMGRHAAAVELAEEARETREALLPKDNLSVAQSKTVVAGALRRRSAASEGDPSADLRRSETMLREALRVYDEKQKNVAFRISVRGDLAAVLAMDGRVGEARAVLSEAEQILLSMPPSEQIDGLLDDVRRALEALEG